MFGAPTAPMMWIWMRFEWRLEEKLLFSQSVELYVGLELTNKKEGENRMFGRGQTGICFFFLRENKVDNVHILPTVTHYEYRGNRKWMIISSLFYFFFFLVCVCVCAVAWSTSEFCFPLRGLLLIYEPSLMACFKEAVDIFMGSWFGCIFITPVSLWQLFKDFEFY